MARPNVGFVESVYAAFGRRDLAAIFQAFDPRVQIRQSSEVPWGGFYEGHDGARQFFGKLTGAVTSRVTVERYVDAGEHVIAIGRTAGTANATGKPFDVPIAHVWRIRDGKVIEVQFCIDNPTMLASLA